MNVFRFPSDTSESSRPVRQRGHNRVWPTGRASGGFRPNPLPKNKIFLFSDFVYILLQLGFIMLCKYANCFLIGALGFSIHISKFVIVNLTIYYNTTNSLSFILHDSYYDTYEYISEFASQCSDG